MVLKFLLSNSCTKLTVALDAVTAKDGITYERKAIERWFQLKEHSPVTGLDLPDTTLQYNQLIMNRVKSWVEGEGVTRDSSQTDKRPRLSSPTDSHVEILIQSPSGSFARRVSPLLLVAELYKLAFQGMRGLHEHFDLHHNNHLLDAFGDTIQSHNIGNGAIILVVARESSSNAAPAGGKDESSGEAELEELCLVKVFDRTKAPSFSYWVPKRTPQSLASVIFRYWRYNEEKGLAFKPHDVDVWTRLVESGDGHSLGNTSKPWSSLASFFKPSRAKGSLMEEDIFATTTGTTRDGTDRKRKWDLASADIYPLVLKLKLDPHKSEKDMECRAKRERDKLSRVDSMFLFRESQLTSDLLVECLQTDIRILHQSDTGV